MAVTTSAGVRRWSPMGSGGATVMVWFWPPARRMCAVIESVILVTVTSVSSSRAMRLRSPCRGGGVVPDAGQVGGQLLYPGLLGAGELPGVFLAGSVVGFLGLAEGAEGGVPVGFEGVGDEPVGGVDGQVAAAGQVGVVAGAFHVGGAQRVRFGGPVLELGGHLQGGFDGERGEGVDEQLPDGLVQVLAGDRSAGRTSVLDAVALAHVGGDFP